jgi:hypothetical protein
MYDLCLMLILSINSSRFYASKDLIHVFWCYRAKSHHISTCGTQSGIPSSNRSGTQSDTCIHHIYTQGEVTHVRKPQRRMNPTLKDIVKEEIQKLLNVRFIYPISDNKWVSPLVVVPKKVTEEMDNLC